MAQGATIAKKESIPALSIVRAIAIIGVLTVHSTSVPSQSTMLESSWFFLYNFANIFLKFGTTTFIFLSSFVLFYNYYDRPFTKKLVVNFYKRRMTYIIIPYIVFSLFYYFFKLYANGVSLPLPEILTQIFERLLRGNAHTHLYFVFISVQFYILFPLFLWVLKKLPKISFWIIVFGIVAQISFFLVNKYVLVEPVTARGSWSLSYFAYYFLGAYLGIYWDKCKAWIVMSKENANTKRVIGWIALFIIWLAAGLTHVYMYAQIRQKTGTFNTTFMDIVWTTHAFTTALVLMMLSFVIYRNANGKITKFLNRLGELSFGIYLIHPFILMIYRKFPVVSGNSYLHHAWYVGGFISALAISWIIVSVVSRYSSLHWILFGNIAGGKRKQKKKTQQTSTGVGA